jgi:signal peptidase II
MIFTALSARRLGITLILLILALDQATKYWVINVLRLPEVGKIELSAVFDLTMVWNYGVSFGALRADATWERWALVGLSAVISVVFLVWLLRSTRLLTIVALSMVIGGAIGNMIDRVRFGAVADFLDVSGIGFFPWVFNVADSGITVGAILLALDLFLNPDEKPETKPDKIAAPETSAQPDKEQDTPPGS